MWPSHADGLAPARARSAGRNRARELNAHHSITTPPNVASPTAASEEPPTAEQTHGAHHSAALHRVWCHPLHRTARQFQSHRHGCSVLLAMSLSVEQRDCHQDVMEVGRPRVIKSSHDNHEPLRANASASGGISFRLSSDQALSCAAVFAEKRIAVPRTGSPTISGLSAWHRSIAFVHSVRGPADPAFAAAVRQAAV